MGIYLRHLNPLVLIGVVAAALLAAMMSARSGSAEGLVATQVRVSDPGSIVDTGSEIRMSADGRFAVFDALVPSERFLDRELFLYDAEAATTIAITSEDEGEVLQHANNFFAISSDGNTVAYQADNLRWGDPSWFPAPEGFQRSLVFYDRTTGTKQTFDVISDFQVVDLIDGGNVLVFEHLAPGPVPTLFDRRTGEFTYLEFPSQVCDVAPAGTCINHVVAASQDARFVAFSQSVNCFGIEDQCGGEGFLQRAYVLDRASGEATPVSSDDVFAEAVDISDDGKRVLVREQRREEGGPGTCRDVVFDRETGESIEVDYLPDGTKVEWFSCLADTGRLSGNGKHVTLLLPPEAGAFTSAFVRDIEAGVTRLASIPEQDEALDIGGAVSAVVSDNGATVSFISRAANLVDGDEDALLDAFVTSFASEPNPDPTPTFRLTVPNAAKD